VADHTAWKWVWAVSLPISFGKQAFNLSDLGSEESCIEISKSLTKAELMIKTDDSALDRLYHL
jgi:hypothetical protein